MRTIIDSAPIILHQQTPIAVAAARLSRGSLGSLLVSDDFDQVVGIATRSDFLSSLVGHQGQDSCKMVLAQIMSSPVEFVSFVDLRDQLRLMQNNLRLSHFPIVRVPGSWHVENIVGMISLSNIGRRFLQGHFDNQ